MATSYFGAIILLYALYIDNKKLRTRLDNGFISYVFLLFIAF